MENNLTKGKVWPILLTFSLPYLLSCFLQTLYGLADLYIIGMFCPTEATTAVSGGSQVMHMLTSMITGLAMGSTVLIGQCVGAEDREARNRAVGNTVTLFGLLAAVLTVGLLSATSPLVRLLSTPAEAVAGTEDYLRICFAGIPFIIAYNLLSAIFRGMGDSKSPMIFVAVACVFNIGLDFLFIGGLGMGPAGAALGTTLAQAASVIFALIAIAAKRMIEGLRKNHFALRKESAGAILTVGLPILLQNGFIQISFLLITVFANRRGLVDAAAVGVVEKLIGILFLVPSTLLASVSALCAQSLGAKQPERAKEVLRDACLLAAGCGLFFSILFQFIPGAAVGLFSEDAEVIRLGSTYLRSYVWDCIVAGIHFCFSGYFSAVGHSEISFVHNVISIVTARIPIAWVASRHFPTTLFPMGLGAPVGSLISVIVCVIAFRHLSKTE